MRVITLILLITLLATQFTVASTVEPQPDGPHRVIMVFGDMGCHACRVLKSFFDKQGYKYVFVELRICGAEEYEEIANTLSTGYYIPLSIVFNQEGRITGVVVGAYTDTHLWDELLTTSNGTLTVVAETRRNITDKNIIEKVTQLALVAYNTCIKTKPVLTTPKTPEKKWPDPIILSAIVIAILAAATAGTLYWGKRRKKRFKYSKKTHSK